MASKKPTELLERYQAKRDFTKTAEPSGNETPKTGAALSFCIQKHAASHLHYDFRLELDGVLKSWAVAKGPSFNPHEKRLAVEVEDHPLSYGGFEGIIPQGQYGGGTVMLWDRGTWEPLSEPHAGLEEGDLKFLLHGEKLHGKWVLVRMHPRPGDRHPNWLLIKEKDDFARPDGPSLPENDDESAISGRTMAQIAAEHAHTWNSNRPAGDQPEAFQNSPQSETKRKAITFIEPELATLAAEAPTGKDWLHEIKFDGYRLLAQITDSGPVLFTRKGLDWTRKFPEIAASLKTLPVGSLLDGELVVLRPDGVSDFALLQAHIAEDSQQTLSYFAFDLLFDAGEDIRTLPLYTRKERLQALLAKAKAPLFYTDHVAGGGPAFFKQGCAAGLEGIICKPAAAPYRSGRVGDWLKVKCGQRQEFIICGFVPAENDAKAVGSLSVAFYDSGVLTYAGRVGTGFTHKSARELAGRLLKLKVDKHPFAGRLPRLVTKDVIWVKPELVAEIAFGNFTPDKIIRHASFKGLREDKPAAEVVPEVPVEAPATASAAKHAKKASPGGSEMEIAGVRVTHPDKVLDEESGLTKLKLADYYTAIADWVLPHIVGRPLSVVRCPDGAGKACFFQRHMAPGLSSSVHEVQLGKGETYLAIDDLAGLIGLVQFGSLELHPWGAKAATAEFPDRMVIDLDPDPTVPWAETVKAAFLCRDTLAELRLQSFVKTTGGKGLHIVVPLDGRQGWPVIKAFARDFANLLTSQAPDKFLAEMSKAKRQGKIFIDYLRNERSATAVAPYSTRARPGAPVSVPLSWDELTPDIDPKSFHIENVQARITGLKADPWAEIANVKQGLSGKS
jgi:bifunctional non-homologous end joining protein LigD